MYECTLNMRSSTTDTFTFLHYLSKSWYMVSYLYVRLTILNWKNICKTMIACSSLLNVLSGLT